MDRRYDLGPKMRSLVDESMSTPCASADPELFWVFEAQRDLVAAAKALCRSCRVRDACLQWALEHGEQGIWGGTTERERQLMRRMQRGVA